VPENLHDELLKIHADVSGITQAMQTVGMSAQQVSRSFHEIMKAFDDFLRDQDIPAPQQPYIIHEEPELW
jgi:hypothetical protein